MPSPPAHESLPRARVFSRFVSSPRALASFGFVLALSAAYLLSTSRERPWTEGSYVYFTAERLVQDGTTALDFPAAVGPNGRSQSPHPLLPSLVHVPGALLKALWNPLWRGGDQNLLVLASHLAPAVLTAGTCWLFLQMCLFLGLRRVSAGVATATLAFGTIVWVYARSPWPPAVQTFVFTGYVFAALRMNAAPTARTALALGGWSAALVNSKWELGLALPLVALWLVWRLRRDRSALRHLALSSLPLALGGVVLVCLDSRLRYGTFSHWWHLVESQPMRQGLFMGLWSLFLAPGKSFLVYSPPLVLSFFGFRTLYRRHQLEVTWVLTAALVPYLLYLARLSHWTGDWAWGPRYCVFMTPALLLPGAAFVDEVIAHRQRLVLAAASVLLAAGLYVQVLGTSLYWDHYIRVAKQARAGWLGVPNRSGALNARPGGECDPCFEDIHPMIWLAPFNPIEGHAWLLGHVLAGDPAEVAEADAAWHRYTSVKFPIHESYVRARVDWWFLNFLPKRWGKGVASLLALMSLVAGGLWLWRRHGGRASEEAE
ncbi:MAG: hypothetical protein KA712_13195 [Myxococcales bacterium]|nr:hypothetical protein [Myxococcales bacterium]